MKNDLIRRQDVLHELEGCDYELKDWQRWKLKTMVRDIPSAEQEIIRCRDCKHWYSDADCGMACELTNMSQPEDGFCNWAERKEE